MVMMSLRGEGQRDEPSTVAREEREAADPSSPVHLSGIIDPQQSAREANHKRVWTDEHRAEGV